jgi:hypothetical protein
MRGPSRVSPLVSSIWPSTCAPYLLAPPARRRSPYRSDRGNMRAQGVRSLAVTCWLYNHDAVVPVDRWPDHVPVPSSGPRMVCTGCGSVGADARPDWSERPSLPSPHRGVVELGVQCCTDPGLAYVMKLPLHLRDTGRVSYPATGKEIL